MKKAFVFLSLVLAFGGQAMMAQLPVAGAPSILLDVQNKAAGGAGTASTSGGVGYAPTTNNTSAQVSSAGSSATMKHSTRLEIKVSSINRTPADIQVEWYFFAKDVKNYHTVKEYVIDSGNKAMTLKPSDSETFEEVSKEVETKRVSSFTTTTSNPGSTTAQTSYSSYDAQGGTTISGWVVRVLYNGQVIAARGSEFKYEDAAKSPTKFEALKAGRAQ
ncbi:MAG TPA: hypothetical protein VG733_20340 [Chthoniobacteraceae bacterium]|nr:hypothetical protein [Chthoniobacteraceae bacterium]